MRSPELRCALLTAIVWSAPALAVNVNDSYLQTNYAGNLSNFYDSANAWPSVASLGLYNAAGVGQGCTGTLINSRTILTAAHCLSSTTAQGTASFSNSAAAAGTSNDRTLAGALANPLYKGGGANYDIALVTVAQPITALTPVRVAVPSDFADPSKLVGQVATIVGYGTAGTGTQPGTPITVTDPVTGKTSTTTQLAGWNDGKRRVVTTTISSVTTSSAGSPPGLITAVFRNPAVDKTAPALQGQPEKGDSGGPLLVQVGSQWIEIGTVVGGPSGYGSTDTWTWIADSNDWLTKNNPLQSVTSNAGTYNWNAPSAWSTGEVPNNQNGSIANSSLGRFLQVNINTATNLTVNMSPTVDKLMIDYPTASVSISEGQTLSSVLDTTLNRGTLDVAGTLSAGTPQADDTAAVLSRIVVAGGTLSGNGTLTATNGVLQTGGVIAPGSATSTGTLTLTGNFVQQAGGTLLSRLSATHSSVLAVSGSATLGGNLLIGAITGQTPSTDLSYTVLTAGSITGTFSSVKSTLAFLTPTASYASQAVDVSLARNSQPMQAVATNATATGVAKALDNVPASNPVVGQLVTRATVSSTQVDSTTKALIIDAVGSEGAADALLQESDAQNDLALSSLAGEGLVAAQNVAFSNATLFVEGIRQQSQNWLAGLPAPGSPLSATPSGSSSASAWVNVQGGSALLRGDGTNYGINSGGVNVQVGANYQINPQAMVGVAIGGSNSSYSVPDLSTSGNLSTVNLGIYGIARHEDFYASGTLAFARNSVTTNRTATVFDLNDQQKANFSIDTLSARLELGYRVETPLVNITPFGAIEPTWLWQSAFTESQQAGGNSAASLGLNVKAQQTTSLPASLGLQFDRRVDLENGWSLSPVVRAAWIREFMPQRSIDAELQMAPGETFTSYGLSAATNVAQFSLGLLVTDNKTVSGYVSGTAYASDRGQAWQAQLGVNIRF